MIHPEDLPYIGSTLAAIQTFQAAQSNAGAPTGELDEGVTDLYELQPDEEPVPC